MILVAATSDCWRAESSKCYWKWRFFGYSQNRNIRCFLFERMVRDWRRTCRSRHLNVCVRVNFDRQPSSIPSFLTIERSNGIHPLTFLYGYNFNANSKTLHWFEKRTQFWQILLGNSMLLLPIEFVQFHSLGACFDQYDKSNFMSGLSYFMSDFWLFL